jgi:PAS domain S-box-containing protein
VPDSQQLMTQILENLPLGVFVVNPGGVIRYANPAMTRVSGLGLHEMVGSNILEVESYRRDGVADGIAAVLAGGSFRRERFTHVSLVGKTSIRNAWGMPLAAGPQTRALIFVEDITAEAEAEDRERRLQAQLLQAQKMESIGRLAGGVAHDFNNLLSVILGYGEMAAGRLAADHPAAGNVARMCAAGERAAGLTRQLLAFSRKQTLQLAVLDLAATAGNVLTLLRRIIGEDIAIRFETRGGGMFVEADAGQLEQVVLNLAMNARDAMPDGGELVLEMRRVRLGPGAADVVPGEYVELTVSDTGEGMSPEVAEQVFEPFFTTKGAGQGTGLGLATVYGVVTQHGGTVTVDSRPGAGSRFTVRLPATDARPSGAVDGREAPLRGGTETLLVVEDEHEIRGMIAGSLGELGYRVVEAASGEEALAAVARHPEPPDLLLTDVVMPAMNGRDLAERLRAAHPGVAVIFMSGYTGGAIARHGVLEPGVTFLQKPVTPARIAAAVRRVLDARGGA